MIEVCEIFSKAKSDSISNEDGYYISNNYVVVVDGATSKTNIMQEGLTGGAKIKDVIINVISGLCGAESMKQVVLEIQRKILDEVTLDNFGPSAASAIIYAVNREEIWSIGDCQMLVDGKHYTFNKKIDLLTSAMRCKAIERMLEEGYTVDNLLERDLSREEILPVLREQKKYENARVTLGYCVFNNSTQISEFPVDMIEIIKVGEAREIVLASDGYPELCNTLAESEYRLHEIIKEDPLCYKVYKSTKGVMNGNNSFDDRTYVKFVRR